MPKSHQRKRPRAAQVNAENAAAAARGDPPPTRVALDGANVAWYGQNFRGGAFNYDQLQQAMESLETLFSTDDAPPRVSYAPLLARPSASRPLGGRVVTESRVRHGERRTQFVLGGEPVRTRRLATQVLPRKNVARKLKPAQRALVERWLGVRDLVKDVPPGSDDDWYWMLSTLSTSSRAARDKGESFPSLG